MKLSRWEKKKKKGTQEHNRTSLSIATNLLSKADSQHLQLISHFHPLVNRLATNSMTAFTFSPSLNGGRPL